MGKVDLYRSNSGTYRGTKGFRASDLGFKAAEDSSFEILGFRVILGLYRTTEKNMKTTI